MPQAFQSGCAARARATAARTSVGPALSSSPKTSPVAGFTEAIRETAMSALLAICEEVYAGRNACARGNAAYDADAKVGIFRLRRTPRFADRATPLKMTG